jgi:hypothetical protein
VPTVAIVEGVKIVLYANEHPPPHFHAKIGEHHAVVDIESLSVVAGFLPVAKRRIVVEWAASRRSELMMAFVQATSHERVDPIE